MREKVKLTSTAGTDYAYETTKNRQKTTEKIQLKKYEPRARRYIFFVQCKQTSYTKNQRELDSWFI